MKRVNTAFIVTSYYTQDSDARDSIVIKYNSSSQYILIIYSKNVDNNNLYFTITNISNHFI